MHSQVKGVMEPCQRANHHLRLQTRFVKATVIQVPTNAADENEKGIFYEQLQQVFVSLLAHDLKIVMGDFNAQTGMDNRGWEKVMGKQAAGDKTDNEMRLLSICSGNELVI